MTFDHIIIEEDALCKIKHLWSHFIYRTQNIVSHWLPTHHVNLPPAPLVRVSIQQLPIEKQSAKLAKKKARDDKLASEELQTNIAQMHTYTLPSGQEITKENILV